MFREDLSQPDACVREQVTREVFAEDFYDPTNPPGMQHGHDGHLAVVNLFMGAFPDMRWEVEDLLADGDKVVARTTMTGTHGGDFFGIPASGREVRVAGIHMLTLRDGKIVRHDGVNDDLGLMRQLGVG
jgi:steroid delta-isomerase-like uncharacterized protein